ncbi:circularly permuted type 2 ATP-grasp protein [Conexibacter sp. DBS9H8]|uniref:circularly permuted type 2 ATP-grasp protein n=1 Tax=Conexibacter sp. DBS9H8 TaxID=2937801 RepID=UPI00200C3FCD|nr:circularly permuted type 2 ATP-grasp protein [Conexibacter sp. DBS9H8]
MTGTILYRPPAGRWDEMLEPDGRPRPHVGPILDAITGPGPGGLERRRGEVSRLLAQDGVVYAGGRWRLDPVPAVLPAREWRRIETGLRERAELLSLVLDDLYGQRRLLTRRLLPAELILADPRFLRPGDGIGLTGAGRPSAGLLSYAADLGRDAAGEMIVLEDRAETPAGVAYALANRRVLSQVLPALHRDSQVQRLAPFLRTVRAALQEAAPAGVEDPRIVVLTPGPLSATAYEHAALAATLGFPLVQGRDLTVRGERVWMRSVGRFEPVDVILRRVHGDFCDPLELRGDSQLGVPGLLEAARAGRVSLVNHVGAAILENPGLMAALPRVAEALLGRPLTLAGLPTWWCGEPAACAYVLEHLDTLGLLGLRGPRTADPIIPAQLSVAARGELIARIRHDPAGWVAREELSPACAPVLGPTGWAPRESVLRAFAVARGGEFTVLPGGLTRLSGPGPGEGVSAEGSAGLGAETVTRDTWVLSAAPEPVSALWLAAGRTGSGVGPMASIPAAAAESLWWLGRYAERAEALTRLTRTVNDRYNDFANADNPAGRACLSVLEGALEQIAEAGGRPLREAAGPAIAGALRAMLENAEAVRDQLSRDTWLVIGPLESAIAQLEPTGGIDDPAQAALAQVIASLLALSGLGVESMVRDLGWRFMDAGRRLERSLQLLVLLEATLTRRHGRAADSLLLESVLSASESIITYRFRYRSQAQVETVLDLLLCDHDNPRSLAHALGRLSADLDALPEPPGGRLATEQGLVLEATTALALAEPATLLSAGAEADHPALAALLGRLRATLTAVGAALEATHFTHVTPSFTRLDASGVTVDATATSATSVPATAPPATTAPSR